MIWPVYGFFLLKKPISLVGFSFVIRLTILRSSLDISSKL